MKFGSARDNDQAVGIRFGQLKLSGSDVASFFQPSIACVVEAVKTARKDAKHEIKVRSFSICESMACDNTFFLCTARRSCRRIFRERLVAEANRGRPWSPWVECHPSGKPCVRGLPSSRDDIHLIHFARNKAVSDGATSFYLDHYVRARVSKMAYGIFHNTTFDPNNPGHFQRQNTVSLLLSGTQTIPGAFSTILPKVGSIFPITVFPDSFWYSQGTQVSETNEFRQSFYVELGFPSQGCAYATPIQCYRGDNPVPKWKDEDTGEYLLVVRLLYKFTTSCQITSQNYALLLQIFQKFRWDRILG